jgi:hypothetical protein
MRLSLGFVTGIQHLQATAIWQHDIQHEQVEAALLQLRARFSNTIRNSGRVTQFGKDFAGSTDKNLVVIN